MYSAHTALRESMHGRRVDSGGDDHNGTPVFDQSLMSESPSQQQPQDDDFNENELDIEENEGSTKKGRKRGRVEVACVQCRTRKTRCDGQQPVCGRCSQRGLPCEFIKKFTRARVSAEYVKGLEHKLAQLENVGADSSAAQPLSYTHVELQPPDPQANVSGTFSNQPQDHLHRLPNAASPLRIELKHEQGSNEHPNSTTDGTSGTRSRLSSTDEDHEHEPLAADAMGAATIATQQSNQHKGGRQDFYGSSSALSFMKLVEAAVNAGKEHDSPNSTTSGTFAKSPYDGSGTTPSSTSAPASAVATQTKQHNSSKQSRQDASMGLSGGFAVKTLRSMDCGRSTGRKYSMLSGHGPKHGAGNKMLSEEDWAIPPRRTADHYVQCYFTYVYSLYPFLHQPSFMKAYQAIWEPDPEPVSDYSSVFVGPETDTKNSDKTTTTPGSKSKKRKMGDGTSTHKSPDHMFYCIMNTVFAFGCLFSPSLESPSKATASLVYFDRARDHLNSNFNLLDTGDAGSLMLLQALLLIGQYLQATEKPAACWNVVGLAIRVAQELGLHREYQICSRPSCIEQEICRRLWHGCVLMDRIVSMTFGRPLMVTQNFRIRLPTFVNDEYITDEKIMEPIGDPAGEPRPSILVFFKQTVLLYEILADILKTFYDAHGNGPVTLEADSAQRGCRDHSVDWLKQVIEIDNRLAKWRNNIPVHLKKEPTPMRGEDHSPIGQSTTFGIGVGTTSHYNNQQNRRTSRSYSNSQPSHLQSQSHDYSPFVRQTNVLEARYLHIQIMLYRPILLPHGNGNGNGNGSDSNYKGELRVVMENTACRMCVSAAVKLIALIYHHKSTPNLPAMWYCMFYVYTSATVLLAAKLQPALEGSLDAEEMAEAWRMALALLRLFERQHGNASATRCLRVLEVLHEQISRAGGGDAASASSNTPGELTTMTCTKTNGAGDIARGPAATGTRNAMSTQNGRTNQLEGSRTAEMASGRFEYLPKLVEPTLEFLDQRDTNLLFTMISDQTGPFDDHTFEYSYTDLAALNF